MVFRRRAQQRRASDVDLLDHGLDIGGLLLNSFLEWVEIDNDQPDWRNLVRGQSLVCKAKAEIGKNAAMDRRVQRFHAPFEDFREARYLGYRQHRNAMIPQMGGRPASGNDLDAQKLKLLRELSQLRFIGNRYERPANRKILMCGHALLSARKVHRGQDVRLGLVSKRNGLLLRQFLEFPMDRRGLGALALEHDLQRAPEANRIGEENALLHVDFGAIGEKAPSLAAGRGKRDGVGVARKICRDARMQMKADGEAAEGLGYPLPLLAGWRWSWPSKASPYFKSVSWRRWR